MSENPFRILVAAGNDSDRNLLVEAIAKADLCAKIVSKTLDPDMDSCLSQNRFDAAVLDYGDMESTPDNPVPTILPPCRVICIANRRQKDLILGTLQQGADVLLKEDLSIYPQMLPLKLRTILGSYPQPMTHGGATDPLPGEYEQLTHGLFEHSPNMIFINAAGRVVYANKKCVELMGYSRQEFYSPDFNFLTLIAPESIDAVKVNFGREMRGQEVQPYDYTLMTKSGRRIEAIMSGKVIQFRGSRAVLGIVTDITHRRRIEEELTRAQHELERRIRDRTEELVRTNESLLIEVRDRRLAQEALRESEKRYRVISSLTSDFVYVMSAAEGFKFEWVGGAFEKITGYKPDEVSTFERRLSLVHPEDVPALRNAAAKIASGQSVEAEYRIYPRDGRLRWLHDHLHPMRDEQTGRITYCIGAVRDVTERKQALEALKESELKFKMIFENAGGAIFIADAETGTIVECNTEAQKMTGLPRSGIIGMHQSHLHPPQEAAAYQEKFREHFEAGHQINFEGEIMHADGRRIPVWISSQALPLSHGEFLIGLFIDITARRRADRQRVALMEILEEKNRELESIIHVAAHDIRTPLITIRGFAGELQDSCASLSDLLAGDSPAEDSGAKVRAIVSQDIPEAVQLITAGAAKLNSLIDGLTRLARFDYSADEMTNIDMDAMIAEIIKTMTYQARHRKVRFSVEPLPCAWGDEQQISQVFSNLIGNALKYLDPARSGLISIHAEQTENGPVYCVEDNGIGIDANNLPHIFKMYYRINPAQTEGEGLGLPIVRRILSRHNGKVWARSKEGTGSRFFVALPNRQS